MCEGLHYFFIYYKLDSNSHKNQEILPDEQNMNWFGPG